MSLSAEKTNNDFASLGAARFLFLAYKHNCSSFCEGLVEIWEDRNSFYLFMELCSGGELYHSISARYGLHASLKVREIFQGAWNVLYKDQARCFPESLSFILVHAISQVNILMFLGSRPTPSNNLSLQMRRGSLPEWEAALVMKVVLQVLKHCHSNGIIHRDVKPENFMLKVSLS